MPKLVICRTMYCPKCHTTDHPTKGDYLVVYGSNSNKMFFYKTGTYGIIGFTPHLIFYDFPKIVKNGKVHITCSCGICETVFDEDFNKIIVKKTREYDLPEKDFNALFFKWKRTGYEI